MAALVLGTTWFVFVLSCLLMIKGGCDDHLPH